MHSELPDSIQEATGATYQQSCKWATTHCNSIVTYAVWYAKGLISMSYAEFLKWGLYKGAINKFGFLEWTLDKILADLAPDTAVINHVLPFKYNGDKIYKMKITNIHGTHFMGAYNIGDTLFISDPNCRGVGVTADSLMKGDKVENLKEFV